MQVLLVEDDPSIAQLLVAALGTAGHDVEHVTTGSAAMQADPGDMVLLDLGLPDMDGYDVCRAIRAGSDTPIIVITARSEEFDQVLALELGADDYVVKPFGFRQLHARMRAVARRSLTPTTGNGAATTSDESDEMAHSSADTSVAGGLRLDRRTHRVTLHDTETSNVTGNDDGESEDGRLIELTPKEFDLLAYLIEDPGAVRSRTDILDRVWDANWFGPTKTIDAHVAGLRRKLGDHRWIEAVRGVGFRLVVPGSE